ncbi:protein phosphatase 2C 29-like [Nymphaea colorata]|nr:protein phosphatase 2C 29-like [Nymphaea colorata]
MGNGVSSTLLPCIKAEDGGRSNVHFPYPSEDPPLDETLGHSFCYVRHAPGLSSSDSARFSPSTSGRLTSSSAAAAETTFRSISGASVSANLSAPTAVFSSHGRRKLSSGGGGSLGSLDAGGDCGLNGGGKNGDNFFVGSSFFSSIPLQPVPRVPAQQNQEFGISGRFERGFMSGPLERGAYSGPLDRADSFHFSAPLGKKKKRKGLSAVALKRAFHRSFSEKNRPWVFPMLNFAGLHQSGDAVGSGGTTIDNNGNCGNRRCCDYGEEERSSGEFGDNLQWAHGKAGEDRVHVVVSEDNGWLFVGIYDGFNGPDATDFLMSNLYQAIFDELEGVFWEAREDSSSKCAEFNERMGETVENSKVGGNKQGPCSEKDEKRLQDDGCGDSMKEEGGWIENRDRDDGRQEILVVAEEKCSERLPDSHPADGSTKRATLHEKPVEVKRGKLLQELLAEEGDAAYRFWAARDFPVVGRQMVKDHGFQGTSAGEVKEEDGWNGSGASAPASATQRKGRSLLFSKLKRSFSKHKQNQRKLSRWSYDFDKEKFEVENQFDGTTKGSCRKCTTEGIDHEAVLKALSKGLETTERAYLDMTDKALDQNPELALVGSCLLVVLMKDEDVYVMNVGDSRAIVAQGQTDQNDSIRTSNEKRDAGSVLEGIHEDASDLCGSLSCEEAELSAQLMKLTALQLSTDHSTSIEEEVLRIKREHPDDSRCIVNDRVKGRLKVTRAFGAGFLKQAKWNNALLGMFRSEYIGTAPYISCSPSLSHHRIGPKDQFLVLSSDGLYQYLSNEEVVSHVGNFMEKFTDGDPAQYLIEELLFRAAKKAGMDFHELLDIPQGDRRKYHDDVTVMVISLEGRIWKSSGKY